MISYEDIRRHMLPGDVIAFGGKGNFSNIIKWRTRSQVSHVGTILQTGITGDIRFFNQLIEATSLNGFNGVSISRVSDRLRGYKGNVWWLPLSDEAREKFDEVAFFDFMFQQVGKLYDTAQAIKSAIDWLPWCHNKEDFQKLFCSELLAGGDKAGGLINLNCSEVTPVDACRWKLYKDCYQLRGEPTEIRRFNSVTV